MSITYVLIQRYAARTRISYEAFKADSFLRWDFCRDCSCRGYDRTQQLNLLRISVIKPFEMNCFVKFSPFHTKTSHHIHHTSPGLLNNSIFFCWLLPIKDLCKKCTLAIQVCFCRYRGGTTAQNSGHLTVSWFLCSSASNA